MISCLLRHPQGQTLAEFYSDPSKPQGANANFLASASTLATVSLSGRWTVIVSEHRVEAPGERGHVTGLIERRHSQHEHHQRLDGESSAHHTTQEAVRAHHNSLILRAREGGVGNRVETGGS